MKDECELLKNCGFFQKYQEVKDLACRGFIRMFCRGPRMEECKRKQYREKHGAPPSDDMLPTGQMVAGSQPFEGGLPLKGWEDLCPIESPPL
ncbi:MAG: hypothetical protein JW719_07285 [Pirellulales bacterium]|nr:hypothetical protein [Pirellulales bacterium]